MRSITQGNIGKEQTRSTEEKPGITEIYTNQLTGRINGGETCSEVAPQAESER
jgi:hypothetical protein